MTQNQELAKLMEELNIIEYFDGRDYLWRKFEVTQNGDRAYTNDVQISNEVAQNFLDLVNREREIARLKEKEYMTGTFLSRLENCKEEIEDVEIVIKDFKKYHQAVSNKLQSLKEKKDENNPTIDCPKHGLTKCVGIKNGVMCEKCYQKEQEVK